ncbi:MAG: sucrose-phosphate phosphatase [Prochlorotrichaceae cyanobacterium]
MNLALFVTDLDNTLVGDDAALLAINQHLTLLRQQYQTKIVYSTGRSLQSYQGLAQEKQLLTPDVLVTAVGTEIYRGSAAAPDADWWTYIAQGWDRPQIETIALKFADLVPQPDTEQRPYKVSFYLDSDQAETTLAKLEQELQQAQLPAQIVYSGGKDVDILPQRADKGSALEFLRSAWGILPQETVACGDSGNDRTLFATGEHWGIIVGNAQPELKTWHDRHPSDRRYFASAYCAAGILEGLRHFQFLSSL